MPKGIFSCCANTGTACLLSNHNRRYLPHHSPHSNRRRKPDGSRQSSPNQGWNQPASPGSFPLCKPGGNPAPCWRVIGLGCRIRNRVSAASARGTAGRGTLASRFPQSGQYLDRGEICLPHGSYAIPVHSPPVQSSSSFKTAIKASEGTETVPKVRIRFLPSFCFSSSFFFRVMSPP